MANLTQKNTALVDRQTKLSYLYLLIALLVVIFLISLLKTIHSDRNIPSYSATIHDHSFRGDILSADNHRLSYSQKNYKAVIHAKSIRPQKRELFLNLFSIYANIDKKILKSRFKTKQGKDKNGYITLSEKINTYSASQLKSLAYKLRQLNVFQPLEIKPGVKVLYGLDIIEIGEIRHYPLGNTLSPILGYVQKQHEENYIRPIGKKGIEGHYEQYITSQKNGYFKGKRDVGGNIIHNKNSIHTQRVDGVDLHLNIALKVQTRLEQMIDKMKRKLEAEEVLVGVMESTTGKILGLATTGRYHPQKIKSKELPLLNPKFSEYSYESGSVLKPITLSIALEHKVVTPKTWFDTEDGRMKIEKYSISDDHKFDSLTAEDIIVESSNIGIAKIAWRLKGQQLYDGFTKFGLGMPSGIDLTIDKTGLLQKPKALDQKIYAATSSYGHGMRTTFLQLLKAYSAFDNEGKAVTPRLVNHLEDNLNNSIYEERLKVGHLQATTPKVANTLRNILIKTVKRGTGVHANYEGLIVGGKTGTAHISSKEGGYGNEYHSSFFGFANDDKGAKYTIGVLVIKPKAYKKYFASQSAAPTFKNAVHVLVEQGYLTAKESNETISQSELYGKVLTKPLTPKEKAKKAKPTTVKKDSLEPKKPSVSKPKKLSKKPTKQKTSKPKIKPKSTKAIKDLFNSI